VVRKNGVAEGKNVNAKQNVNNEYIEASKKYTITEKISEKPVGFISRMMTSRIWKTLSITFLQKKRMIQMIILIQRMTVFQQSCTRSTKQYLV